jgi:quercetin dioxygenase-like cupin family protein
MEGTHVTLIGRGVLPHGLRLHLSGETDFVFEQVTLEPGASTGWHSHPGPLLVVVRSGTLTHDACGRATRTFREGDAFVELPGAGNEHCGRNLGTEPVTLDVLSIAPSGSAAQTEVLTCSA